MASGAEPVSVHENMLMIERCRPAHIAHQAAAAARAAAGAAGGRTSPEAASPDEGPIFPGAGEEDEEQVMQRVMAESMADSMPAAAGAGLSAAGISAGGFRGPMAAAPLVVVAKSEAAREAPAVVEVRQASDPEMHSTFATDELDSASAAADSPHSGGINQVELDPDKHWIEKIAELASRNLDPTSAQVCICLSPPPTTCQIFHPFSFWKRFRFSLLFSRTSPARCSTR